MGTSTVVVVGAGPTGLALACGLLAGGVQVRVLDKAAGPAETSRALGLQPRGAEVIDRLGALRDLPERSVRVGQVLTHVNGELVARLRVGQRTRLVTRPGLLISQAEVESRLRDRLTELGGQVEWGSEVAHVAQDGDGVRLQLADGGHLRAAWLVGCDGAHSRVRKSAGIEFPGVPVIERFLLADVRAELPLPRDAVSVWLRGEHMVGAFPLPGRDVWRLMTPAPEGLGESLSSDGLLAAVTRALSEEARVPADAVTEVLWTSSFRIHRRLASTYRSGRVLLAGDAAHIHSPFGGQGMNTGLGDAENLAWKLALVATGRADDSLLASYEAERRPIAAEVLESTSAMTRVVVGESPVARAVRDRLFVPLMNRPLVQRMIWETASQLKISYRRGPLAGRSLPTPFRSGPRPGDRVPDMPCARLDGSRTSLHRELGARWVLLVPRALAEPEPEPEREGDHDHAAVAHRRLGTKDAVTVLVPADTRHRHALLVRPDAHLAWRGASPAALDRWLAGMLDDGRVR